MKKYTLHFLACIFTVRMFGLFLVLPVLTPYLRGLPHITPWQIGAGIGVYGLTQALLQIPAGYLSDVMGRRIVIGAGLLIFALGSMLVAMATTSTGIILGRALQGAGAISSAIIAFVSDVVPAQQRTKAMAYLGSCIGASFFLAVTLSPMLAARLTVPGMFVLVAVLALLALLILLLMPKHERVITVRPVLLHTVRHLVQNQRFVLLCGSALLLNSMMILYFTYIARAVQLLALHAAMHSTVYGAAFLLSILVMLPIIIAAEKYAMRRTALIAAVLLLASAVLGFTFRINSPVQLIVLVTLFFSGLNILEAILPSWVSLLVPADIRGTAMGIFTTAQFLGPMIGGAMVAILSFNFSLLLLVHFCSCIFWLFLILWFIPARAQIVAVTQ